MALSPETSEVTEASERSNLSKVVIKVLFLVLTIAGVGLAVVYIFGFSIGGKILYEGTYYYSLMTCFLPLAFLLLPMRKKDKGILRWYNIMFAALAFGSGIYLSTEAYSILVNGFLPMSAPYLAVSIVFFLLLLELARRSGGPMFASLALFFGLFPMFAKHMPGVFFGLSYPFDVTMGQMVLSATGILGIPSNILGNLFIGFLIFAGVLIASGAGKFFLNLALAIFGRYRGGVAKVAVVSSAFFGSLSGSAISNVIATGSVTIPAMKKMGYPSHYAGAIEACASTGGVLMPPVMGAIIFVMASLLNIEYRVIMVAAFIPALLYYFALLMQVDAYAAKAGLKGLSKAEIPSMMGTLREGWPFVTVLVFLVWGLAYMRWEALAPFYASGLLILLSFARAATRLTWRRFTELVESAGQLISQSFAVILPIGFIIGGLTVTGVAPAIGGTITTLGRENIALVVLLTVMISYVFGMAGAGIASYVILAITVAPALIRVAGLNVLAVHLFLAYYGMLAIITPPVAVAAFVAAGIAGSAPLKTAVQSMRLGVVIYLVPFFFLFNPALILEGSNITAVYCFVFCLVGLTLIAGGAEGYLVKVGKVPLWSRPLLVVAGFLWAFPEWITTAAGAAMTLILVPILLRTKKLGELFP